MEKKQWVLVICVLFLKKLCNKIYKVCKNYVKKYVKNIF